MILSRVLSGGSTVLYETVPGTRTLSMGFWFPLGSRHEGSSRRGYTHFIEHMLFKGTARRSASDIAKEVDRLGGYLNAFTEREALCFYCTLPASSMETAVDILSDMIFNPSFPEEEFSRERNVILNEIMTAQDDPEDISFDEYLAAIWPDHDLSAKIAGEEDEVKAISLEGLKAYHAEYFHPENLLICVAGSFDPDRLLLVLDRMVPTRNEARAELPERGHAPVYKKIREYKKASIQQVQLYAGKPFVPSNTVDEYYRLSVFNCAFGESMGSRLFQNIRERLGYCYSVFSFFSLASDIGLWTVNGSSSESHFRPFFEAVMKEVGQASREGLSAAEVNDAILHLEGATIMASEDMEHRMKRLARQHMHNGVILEIDETLSRLKDIRLDDVNEAARLVLDPEGMSVFAYGSRRRKASWMSKEPVTQ